MQESVDYLKHRVNEEGLHTSTEKVEAIQQAPVPHNQQQLRSFLGLIQYYGRFIPDLASILAPLNLLLQKMGSGGGLQTVNMLSNEPRKC